MSIRNLLQGNIRLAVLHRSHETPTFVLGFQNLTTGLEVGIELWQLSPEVVDTALEIAVRHKEMFLHIVLFHLIASLTGEDDEFADHIGTAEVDTWVRL